MDRRELEARTGASLSTLKRWARLGIGPRPIKVGPRMVRYRRDEVDAWLAGRPAA
ncbi:hypothetical protein DQ244_01575 [Blastococcus sp. TBT05-19]|nr:hypothetical protein DQ244_01575 [Blastococcus sp. TBT05-19]